MKEYCDDLDETSCLIAASMHDLNHPGRNSAFLCNSNAELAYLYNDITVLENHHASLGFKLTMSDDRVNIFKSLDRCVAQPMLVSLRCTLTLGGDTSGS